MKVVYTPPDPNIVFNDMTPGKVYEIIKIGKSYFKSDPKDDIYSLLNDKLEVKAYRAINFTPIDIIREIVIDDILK